MSQNGSRNATGNQTKTALNSTKQSNTQTKQAKKSVDKNEETQTKTKNTVLQKDPNRVADIPVRFLIKLLFFKIIFTKLNS